MLNPIVSAGSTPQSFLYKELCFKIIRYLIEEKFVPRLRALDMKGMNSTIQCVLFEMISTSHIMLQYNTSKYNTWCTSTPSISFTFANQQEVKLTFYDKRS